MRGTAAANGRAILQLKISQLLLDERTQARVQLHDTVVDEYAASEAAGATLPPVVVFRDSQGRYWLADGRHRREARLQNGKKVVICDVRPGELRDAILFAVGANVLHGLKPTTDDKRRSVGILLDDPEWGRWNNHEIARRCGVSEHLVRDVRQERREAAEAAGQPSPRAKVIVNRGAQTYEMGPRTTVPPPPERRAVVFLRAALELLGGSHPAAGHIQRALGLLN